MKLSPIVWYDWVPDRSKNPCVAQGRWNVVPAVLCHAVRMSLENELDSFHGWLQYNEQQYAWWRHQMKTFSALLALCAGHSTVTGEFPSQRPVTRSFDVFFNLCLNKRLNKQSKRWWFQTPSRYSWRQCNVWNTFDVGIDTNIEVIVASPEGEARGLWWASQVVNETTMTEIEASISILSWWK